MYGGCVDKKLLEVEVDGGERGERLDKDISAWASFFARGIAQLRESIWARPRGWSPSTLRHRLSFFSTVPLGSRLTWRSCKSTHINEHLHGQCDPSNDQVNTGLKMRLPATWVKNKRIKKAQGRKNKKPLSVREKLYFPLIFNHLYILRGEKIHVGCHAIKGWLCWEHQIESKVLM